LFLKNHPKVLKNTPNVMNRRPMIEAEQETSHRLKDKEEQVLPPLPSIRQEPHSEMVTSLKLKKIANIMETAVSQKQQQQQQLQQQPFEDTSESCNSTLKLLLKAGADHTGNEFKYFDLFLFESEISDSHVTDQ
jgi:succinate dehydrogenase/fumarate reductase flavoprotein subunit